MRSVALAYSGKVNGAICIHRLRKKGYRVVAFSANLGQPKYLEPLGEHALEVGAESVHIDDLREPFLTDYVFPALRAGARYDSGYYLGGALSRPILARRLLQVAREEGCTAVAHGGRGVGNDQIRFERSLRLLDTDIEILAPIQELGLTSPSEDIAHAGKEGIDVASAGRTARETMYNLDQTLWGVSIDVTRSPAEGAASPADTYIMTSRPQEAPSRGMTLRIGFREGIPVGIDGGEIPAVPLVQTLNKVGGRYGLGRALVVENRILGDKSRELYEAPGAFLLYRALRALDQITLTKDMLDCQSGLSRKYADLVYQGWWDTSLRAALDAFFREAKKRVTGEVVLGVSGAGVVVEERSSPNSLLRLVSGRAAPAMASEETRIRAAARKRSTT